MLFAIYYAKLLFPLLLKITQRIYIYIYKYAMIYMCIISKNL